MKESDLVLDSPQKILNIQKKIDEIKENNFWLVVGKNSRIIKDWRELVIKYPENTIRCYQHLRLHPLERSPGRIFPLRGKKFKGAWEYELTASDRIFYLPLLDLKKVIVYYAGKHPVKNKYPQPPRI